MEPRPPPSYPAARLCACGPALHHPLPMNLQALTVGPAPAGPLPRVHDDWRLFDELPLPALWLGADNQVDHLNQAARRLQDLQVPHQSAQGTLLPALAWLEQELAAYLSLADLEYSFEQDFLQGTAVRSFNIHVKRLRDRLDQVAATLVILYEVTRQKHMARTLADLRQRLDTLVEERTRQLSVINESLRRYIAECERSGAELRKLSQAVEQAADHIIITDRQGLIEYVNPAFTRLTGWTLKESLGHTPRLVKSGRMEPAAYEKLWKDILAGEVYHGLFINRKKNGEFYEEEKTITPIRSDRGEITHFVSTGRLPRA